VLRTTLGLAIVALLLFLYPASRTVIAQFLGMSPEHAMAADTASGEPANVATKRSRGHGVDNPIATDARAAAGLILPKLPPESEQVTYFATAQPLVADIDVAFPHDSTEVRSDAITSAETGASSSTGRRSKGYAPGLMASAAGGGAAGVAAARPTSAGVATSGTGSSDEVTGTLGDRDRAEVSSAAGKSKMAGAASKTEAAGAGAVTGAASNDTVFDKSHEHSPSHGPATTESSSPATVRPHERSTAVPQSASADIPSGPAAGVMAQAERGDANDSKPSTDVAQSSSAAKLAAAAPQVLADVPEPASLLMLGIALAGMAYRARGHQAIR